MEFDSGERPVRCNPRDLWMATWCLSWDITYAAQRQLQNQRPLYLIQDDERWLDMNKATLSYSIEHYAIFNGLPLRDWFAAHRLGVFSNGMKRGQEHSYTATAALAARVPVTAALLEARRASFKNKKRLAVYYRKHAERNQPQVILDLLSQLVMRGVVSTNEWDFVGISDHGPLNICTLANGTACLRIPPMLAPKQYDEFLGGCDVAISLCTSGGASWPVMDFATHGAVVITNAVSKAHRQFFEDLAPTVLTTSNITVDALVILTARAINMSNILSLEQRAAAAMTASSRFPSNFCSEQCFGKSFVQKLCAWMNDTVVSEQNSSIEMAKFVFWSDENKFFVLALYGIVSVVTIIIMLLLHKRMYRVCVRTLKKIRRYET